MIFYVTASKCTHIRAAALMLGAITVSLFSLLPDFVQSADLVNVTRDKKTSSEVIDWLKQVGMQKAQIDCHAVIQDQPRQEPWASNQEAELHAQFVESREADIFHLECRTTMCEMAVTGQEPASEKFILKQYALRAQGWPVANGLDLLESWTIAKTPNQNRMSFSSYRVFLRTSLFPLFKKKDTGDKSHDSAEKQNHQNETQSFSCRDWKDIQARYEKLRSSGIKP